MRPRWIFLIVPAAVLVASCSSLGDDPVPEQSASRSASDVAAMLPLPAKDVVEAATTAESFASSYGTWRHDEQPDVYLDRLAPYVTESLLSRLAKTTSAQDFVLGRQARHEIVVGRGSVVSLRSVDERRLMFVMRVDQAVTTTEIKSYSHEYALWLVRFGRGRWRVSELSPASESADGSIWIAD